MGGTGSKTTKTEEVLTHFPFFLPTLFLTTSESTDDNRRREETQSLRKQLPFVGSRPTSRVAFETKGGGGIFSKDRGYDRNFDQTIQHSKETSPGTPFVSSEVDCWSFCGSWSHTMSVPSLTKCVVVL